MGEDRVEKAIKDFIVLPLIVVIGLYVIASIIDSMLQLNNETFSIIFAGLGGIGVFIYYFKRKISQL